jgi:small subunit ribosomal protein S6
LIRRYETILLFDIDAGEETRNAFISRSKSLIEEYDGDLLEQDEWGVRKLAYEVRKKTRGYYVRLEYFSETDLVAEFERIIRLEDAVMKYITVMIDETFDPDTYATTQAQMAQATEEESVDFSESPDMQESLEHDDISEDDDSTEDTSDDSYHAEMNDSDDSQMDISTESDVPDEITDESKKED